MLLPGYPIQAGRPGSENKVVLVVAVPEVEALALAGKAKINFQEVVNRGLNARKLMSRVGGCCTGKIKV